MSAFPAASVVTDSYDPVYFAPLFAIEDRHFWFRARNHVITIIAQQVADRLTAGYRTLEVGCGTGNTLRILEQVCTRGSVMGMDLFAEGLSYARQRTICPLVQGDMHAAPFNTQFDLIGLFDVLEHLPDDIQVLHDLHAMLAPDGTLLLTVPAHPSLWSYFDEASHHCRRYELDDLEHKLISTGYRVEYLTYYMMSIFPLIWLGRRFATLTNQRTTHTKNHTYNLATRELRIIPLVNEMLCWILEQETQLIRRRYRLSVGTSLLVVAHKSSSR